MSNIRSLFGVIAVVALFVTPASAQRCLQSTLAGGNAAHGCMFDLQAGANGATITGFSQSFLALGGESVSYEIWGLTAAGSYAGNENIQGNWSLLSSGTATAESTGTPTLLGNNLNVVLGASETRAFYITTTGFAHTSHTNGIQEGQPYLNDGYLTLFEGTAQNYPFHPTNGPRVWNGTVHYTSAGLGPQYQVNSPSARLVINGAVSNGCAPATVTSCQTGDLHLEYRTNTTNQGFEFAVTDQALLPASSSSEITALGQVVNLDFGGFYFFMFGGANPEFVPIPGDWNFDFIAPTDAGVMSFQAYQIDPAHAEGFALSQGVQIDTVAPGLVSGPASDDTFIQVDLAGSPLCWTPSAVQFYGTSYSEIFVSTNGRVTFGAGSGDYSPTSSEALSGAPFVGAWTDLDPSVAGAVTVSASGNVLRVDYNGVPYYGLNTAATFAVLFDVSNDEVHLSGLSGLGQGAEMFLGMSPGGLAGATDPGATDWQQLGGSVGSPTDMIYESGTAGSLASGFNTLRFVPDGAGNYIWLAF